MKNRIFLPILQLVLLAVAGCGSGSPTDPGRPSAFFTFTIQETTAAFVARFTNGSFNSEAIPASSAENLVFAWTFEDKGSSSQVTPNPRIWTKAELGLVEAGDSDLRRVSLTVTEEGNPEPAEHSEVLIFSVTASSSADFVVASLDRDQLGRILYDRATIIYPLDLEDRRFSKIASGRWAVGAVRH